MLLAEAVELRQLWKMIANVPVLARFEAVVDLLIIGQALVVGGDQGVAHRGRERDWRVQRPSRRH